MFWTGVILGRGSDDIKDTPILRDSSGNRFDGFCSGARRTEESFIPNYAVANSYFTWGSDADFSDGIGAMSLTEYGFEAHAPIVMKDGFRLTVGARYRKNTLDFTDAVTPFGSSELDLYRVDIPINAWIELGQKWKFWGRVSPGWYSDFESVSEDDFVLSSLALLSYKWNEKTKIAFGAYYSRDLGEERILPALGFIFEPTPQLSLALTFPRVELVYAPSTETLITSRVLLSGAGWNITDLSGGEKDVDLNYRSVRAGLGIDHRIKGPFWAYLDGGIQFAQQLEIDGGTVPLELDLDPSPYASGGIKVRF